MPVDAAATATAAAAAAAAAAQQGMTNALKSTHRRIEILSSTKSSVLLVIILKTNACGLRVRSGFLSSPLKGSLYSKTGDGVQWREEVLMIAGTTVGCRIQKPNSSLSPSSSKADYSSAPFSVF